LTEIVLNNALEQVKQLSLLGPLQV